MKEQIRQRAFSLGFDIVGFASRQDLDEQPALFSRIQNKTSLGDLSYLQSFSARYERLLSAIPDCQSVIVVGLNYYQPTPPSQQRTSEGGVIARYAWGKDYHEVVHAKLEKLAAFLKELVPDSSFKLCVDSEALMEKPLAVKAGLGFQGKHTLLIHPKFGSWLVLGELLTSIQLAPDLAVGGDCGACKKCIEACPTKALSGDYTLDIKKCIAYHTTESRADSFPSEIEARMGRRIFGCEACVEVCPYSQNVPCHSHPEFEMTEGIGMEIVNEKVDSIGNSKSFKQVFAGTSLARLGLKRLRRNINILNSQRRIKNLKPVKKADVNLSTF